ncbi:MAG TPA: hypothetical protein VF718_13535 [Allosphingosinicella sp.]|jgi:hypothetical protein
MGWGRHLVLLALLTFAAACSMEAAIEKLSSPEDRAFAMRFVEEVRGGDEAALKPQFDPGLWAKSRDQLALARPLFPRGEGRTRLIGYRVATDVTNGESSTTKEFTLVTTDQARWTRTRMVTLARGGPARVVEWNVDGFDEPPPELEMYESMERLAPWLQAGALIGLIGGIALVWWLVRRSRRRAGAGS